MSSPDDAVTPADPTDVPSADTREPDESVSGPATDEQTRMVESAAEPDEQPGSDPDSKAPVSGDGGYQPPTADPEQARLDALAPVDTSALDKAAAAIDEATAAAAPVRHAQRDDIDDVPGPDDRTDG